jgi:hypothetical protein
MASRVPAKKQDTQWTASRVVLVAVFAAAFSAGKNTRRNHGGDRE